MNKDPVLEDLIGQLGVFGKYQLKQHVLHFLTAFLAGMHMFSLTFVAPTPTHRCFVEEVDLNNGSTFGVFDKGILSQYIPTTQADGELDSCRRYLSPFDNSSESEATNNNSRTLVSCDGQFVYDTSIYQQSRVFDWDMVCENKWMRALIQSIYVFGVFNGALFCGSLADRHGRKKILCISALLQFVFAIIGPYITNYVLYCISLFFYGMFGSAGAFVTGFVLSMELVDKKNRAYCGAMFNASFAIGASFVAMWSYLIRDVTLLQTVFALNALLLFGHWWLIDESIRWLWSQGRIKEAVNITRKAVRVNGGSFLNNFESKCKMESLKNRNEQQKQKSFGLLDLFRSPNLRFRAINAAFSWFSISLCFYGLAFNTGALPGNPYLVFFICAIADLPGHLFVTLIVNKSGRRPLHCTLLFLGGLACIITTFIPRGLLATTIAMLAKVALSGCFAVMYNYTAELFPTVVRNSAVGLCSMSARLGGTLTPQITLLNSLDKSIPTLIFGGVAVIASFMGLFLPETLHKELPQSLEDGELYGKGDTAFNVCCRKRDAKACIEDLEETESLNKK